MPANQAMKGVIFVTGGAGYVGSHCVLELLKEDYQVIAVDNFVNAAKGDKPKPDVLLRVEKITGKTVTFYEMNLLDRPALENVFKTHKVDTVIHFAALKGVGESVQIPLDYYRNNVGGTITLLEVMKQYGVKKLIFSSSATVYGKPEYVPIDENHPTGQSCTNPYGRTKYFVEEIMKDLCRTEEGWSIMLLRYFNPVGAHKSGLIGEDPHGIPNNLMPFIAQTAVGRRKELVVFGNDYNTPDGTGVRDYIHVVDLAIGHVAALSKLVENDAKPGCKVYNLGTGKGYSVLDMIKAFEKASGKNVPYRVADRRPGDIDCCYADSSKADKELGWKAARGIVEMCEDTWRWQVNNPNGFNTVTNGV